MSRIRLVRRIGPGIVVLETDGHQNPWTEVTLRTHKTCAVSGASLKPGDKAYSPLGNTMYRYERIASVVVDAAAVSPTPEKEQNQ